MTPKMLSVITFAALFSLSATAAESAEPIPTLDGIEVDVDDSAARKKKKKSSRKRNAQSSRRENEENRSEREENRVEQEENRSNQAERSERRERMENRAERSQRNERAEQRSQRSQRSQRAQRAERREDAARRAARHSAPNRSNGGRSASHHQSTRTQSHHASHRRNTRAQSHRWHHGWSSSHHRPVRWYHGVFVYGPNPYRHNRIRRGYYTDNSPVPMPGRSIDRDGAFSIGLTTGSYMSGYDLGGEFSDFGLGINARFRPVEGLGFEIAYSVHDDTFDGDTERTTTMLAPSVQVFAAPWSRVSPYASVGVTFTDRQYDDVWTDGFEEFNTKISDNSFGPHVGIGLEIALGQNAAIDFEARAIGYLDYQEGGTVPGAIQTTFGAQWYF
jgi:opacity protein-like surface antigen